MPMSPRLLERFRAMPPWAGAAAALLLLAAFAAVREPSFRKPTNLMNIVNEQSIVGVIAVGMTLVIVMGGIDLSVGALVALAGGVGVLALNALAESGASDWLAVVVGLAVMTMAGGAAGALNGALIARAGIAPFIATLGALVAYRSGATWMANGGQFFVEGPAAFGELGRGAPIPGTNVALPGREPREFVVPYAVMVFVAVSVIGAALLNRTRYGRYVIAIGCNEQAARYSAISVTGVKWATYALMGVLTGIAAAIHASRFESVNSANAGILMELEAIAAVVIGGTRMRGGYGTILGTVIGVILLGVIRNVQVMLGLESHAQGVVMGVIILAAVLLQRLGSRSQS
jgi:ribose transport system permease protein